MTEHFVTGPAPAQTPKSVFTIVGGTTIPERAAIVRAKCREGSHIELRRQDEPDADGERMNVWLECRSLLGLLKTWKKIGFVPIETAAALVPSSDESATVVAYGTVKSVYAPNGRDEAVVTVEITPPIRT